jgi:hypothetical protein
MRVEDSSMVFLRGWRRWLRRLTPILIASVVTSVIVRRYPISDIAESLRDGNALAVAPWVGLLVVGYLLGTAAADTLVLRHFGDLRFRDIVRGRAAAAVLTTVGYLVGNGAYGVWIGRATRTGVWVGGGLFVFFMVSDLAAVGVTASAVMPWVPVVPGSLRVAAVALASVPILVLGVGPSLSSRRFAWRAIPGSVAFGQLVLRCANTAFAVMATSMGTRAFGLAVPLRVLAAYMPLLFLVGSLPVNVAGIGGIQAAWLFFFLPFDTGPRILAFQLVWNVLLSAAIIVRGLPFLPRALAQIAE